MRVRYVTIKGVFWKSGMPHHGYPTGAERACAVLLETAPLQGMPSKRWVSLTNVRFLPGPVRMATMRG